MRAGIVTTHFGGYLGPGRRKLASMRRRQTRLMASNRYIHAVSRAPNQLTSTERSPAIPRHRLVHCSKSLLVYWKTRNLLVRFPAQPIRREFVPVDFPALFSVLVPASLAPSFVLAPIPGSALAQIYLCPPNWPEGGWAGACGRHQGPMGNDGAGP